MLLLMLLLLLLLLLLLAAAAASLDHICFHFCYQLLTLSRDGPTEFLPLWRRKLRRCDSELIL